MSGIGWLLDGAAILEGHSLVGSWMHLICLSFVVSGLLLVSPHSLGFLTWSMGWQANRITGQVGAGSIPAVTQDSWSDITVLVGVYYRRIGSPPHRKAHPYAASPSSPNTWKTRAIG